MITIAIPVSIIVCLLLVIGVHTSTQRVVTALCTSIFLFILISLLSQGVTQSFISGGPARHANGEFITDDQGNKLYNHTCMELYHKDRLAIESASYFCLFFIIAAVMMLPIHIMFGRQGGNAKIKNQKDPQNQQTS